MDNLAYLIRHDTVYGQYPPEICSDRGASSRTRSGERFTGAPGSECVSASGRGRGIGDDTAGHESNGREGERGHRQHAGGTGA